MCGKGVIVVMALSLSLTLMPEAATSRQTMKTGDERTSIAAADTVPVRITSEGHIMIEATVDGTVGNFILDTGAGVNVVTSKFASRLKGLEKEDGSFTGFRATGEEIHMHLHRAHALRIGTLEIHDPIVTVFLGDLGNIDGLVALTCFRRQPFTIDFAGKKLYLDDQAGLERRMRDGHVVPIELDDDRGVSLDVFTNIRVNDTLTLLISLDSGAGFNVFRFNATVLQELGIDTSRVQKYSKKSSLNAGTLNIFYTTTLRRLSLATAPAVHVADVKASFLSNLIYDGITCVNWLGDSITFDLPDKKLIVNR